MLHTLEQRLLLHAVLNASTKTLTVNGVSGVVNDTINITQNATQIIVSHVNDASTQLFAKANVLKIVVNCGDGNDKIAIQTGVGGISLPTTINGGNGNDSLTGGDGPDSILAGNGNNTVNGNAGNDTVTGGTGSDLIIGGIGNDSMTGLDGNDQFVGDLGNDKMIGGAGSDGITETGNVNFVLTNTSLSGLGNDVLSSIERALITGGAGNNSINAGTFTGSITIFGQAGNDSLTGGSGPDMILGEDGLDTLTGNAGADNFDGGNQNDLIKGDAGDDSISSTGNVNFKLTNTQLTGLGVDTISSIEHAFLTGGAGNNVFDASTFSGKVEIFGRAGNDKMLGGSGNDFFLGELGNDTINGGGGTDELRESGNVSFTLTNTSLSGVGSDSLSSIELVELTGGAGSNTFNTTAYSLGSVELNGLDGSDTLRVGNVSGNVLRGGTGDDSMFGGLGNDRFEPGLGNDSVVGSGHGTGVLDGDLLVENTSSTLTLTTTSLMGAGNDIISGIELAELYGDASANRLSAAGFVGKSVTLHGLAGNDSLFGSTSAATFDRLSGGFGNDLINGNGGHASDQLYEPISTATPISLTLVNTNMTGNLGTDTLSLVKSAFLSATMSTAAVKFNCSAFTGQVRLEGGNGNDTLIAGENTDILYGRGGNDTMEGRGGFNYLYGEDGDDILRGGFSNLLDGGKGKDAFFSGKLSNAIANDGIGEILTAESGASSFSQNSQLDQFDRIVFV